MTKQRRVLPARKPRDRSRDDDSLLLRSAESLGRVIGALQRQLESATKRLLEPVGEVIERTNKKAKTSAAEQPRSRKRAASKKSTKQGARKTSKKR